MQWPYHIDAHCSISKVENFFFVQECFCTPVCWKAGVTEIPTFNQVQSLGLQKCVVINWNILSKFKLISSFFLFAQNTNWMKIAVAFFTLLSKLAHQQQSAGQFCRHNEAKWFSYEFNFFQTFPTVHRMKTYFLFSILFLHLDQNHMVCLLFER